MIQLFFKTSKISPKDWNLVYSRIEQIVRTFPLKLERIESYNGYSPHLNKVHFDLVVDKDTENEHISFWGDQMSFTASKTIRFYKHWAVQSEKGFEGNEIEVSKPIFWFPPQVFDFSGYPPDANGCKFRHSYLDTSAIYRYAVLAIGVMCENTLPGRAFLLGLDEDIDDIVEIQNWLKVIFNEMFDLPIYFNKIRLLDNLSAFYASKKELVGRMDMLYFRQFKHSMIFAIEHIGYQPALEYYAEVLSHANFGTFGFSDILSPWIAATKDLEKTLQLVSKSKEFLLKDKENERNLKEAEKYDFNYILKKMLKEYILWTPQQREFLEKFHTNKEALEGKQEDLFGSILRMSGYRVDICPIYSTKDALFEAFMYHQPENGKTYLETMDSWISKNENAYNEYVEKMNKIENEAIAKEDFEKIDEKEQELEREALELEQKIEKYVKTFPEHEQFFIEQAILNNPAYMDLESTVEEFLTSLLEICYNEKNEEDVKYVHEKPKEEKIKIIRSRIKDKDLSIHPDFESWLEKTKNDNVLTLIYIAVSLKIYDRGRAFARQLIMSDKSFFKFMEKNHRYELKF